MSRSGKRGERYYLVVLSRKGETYRRIVQRNTRRAAAASARGWLRDKLGLPDTKDFFQITYRATEEEYDAQE